MKHSLPPPPQPPSQPPQPPQPVYKILINERDYSSWTIIDSVTSNPSTVDDFEINPQNDKLFSQDHFTICNNKMNIVKSFVRETTQIAGILILANNKTFGKSGKRHLYQCVPDDKRLPVFLVPYEIKMGFNKDFKNKYVVFKYIHWDSKHPVGQLENVIGTVDEVFNFFDYQLYCKCLQISIADFTKQSKQVINTQNYMDIISRIEDKYDIRDHLSKYTYTIDSASTREYDDAFSIEVVDGKTHVYVYIANVVLWIEIMNLWGSFSKRVSTIYLPDRRRPMLPTILAETLCSLQEGQCRLAMTYEFVYDENMELVDLWYYNSKISVNVNHVYESKQLKKDKHYRKLYDITNRLSENIEDSGDMVSYWMIHINRKSSEKLLQHKCGIFRSVTVVDKTKPLVEGLSDDASRVIKNWNNIVGKYVYFDEAISLTHDLLDEKSYIHISSPIRRLVDLLNQIELMKVLNMNISNDASEFHKKWIYNLDDLNTAMRAIRKIQQECELLHRCDIDPTLLNTDYNGIVFDKVQKTNGMFTYIVYLEELKLLARYGDSQEYDNFKKCRFKLFMFEKESAFKKKIKLQLIE